MRLRFNRVAILVSFILIGVLIAFFPGLPWSARSRHSLKRAITKTEIRLARWRGENPRLASMAGRINSAGAQIEALDSRSGFASLTSNDGNFVLPGLMWYPGATYELVLAENETSGKLLEVSGPRQLPESGRFDVG